jgi:uncharacterized caspase-like protein
MKMNNLFTHGYALLIGVGACAHTPWSLPVTVNDAQALQALLVDPHLCAYPAETDHVRLLHDDQATRAAILADMAWLAACANQDQDATVLLYYSGHGWWDDMTDNYYLIPHDVDPYDLAGTALAAAEFNRALQAIPARRLWVIIDCCHAAGMATAKGLPGADRAEGFIPLAPPPAFINELKRGAGRAVFTSSRGEQRSWIHPQQQVSIYTHHLLEALQGAGNQPGDRLVHLSNVMNHLSQRTPVSAQTLCQAEQTPFFHLTSEDFPVALVRGGKGLPVRPSAPLPVPDYAERSVQHRTPGAVMGQRNVVVSGHLHNNTIVMGDHAYVQLSQP